MNVYIVLENHGRKRCIPNAPGLDGGASLTLCGWTDVAYSEVEGEPNCRSCLAIVRYCRSRKFAKAGGPHEQEER